MLFSTKLALGVEYNSPKIALIVIHVLLKKVSSAHFYSLRFFSEDTSLRLQSEAVKPGIFQPINEVFYITLSKELCCFIKSNL